MTGRNLFRLARVRAVELVDDCVVGRRPATDRAIARSAVRLLREHSWVSVAGTRRVPVGVRVLLSTRDWELVGAEMGSAKAHLTGMIEGRLRRAAGDATVRVELGCDPDLNLGFRIELLTPEEGIRTEMPATAVAAESILRVADDVARACLVGSDGTRVTLPAGTTTLGRTVGGPGLLPRDPRISGTHAAVRVSDIGIEITDLGSTNGTWVDGRRVTRERLVDGSVVRLGRTELRIHDIARRRSVGAIKTGPAPRRWSA